MTLRDDYAATLNALRNLNAITAWKLLAPKFNEVEVTLALRRGDVDQLVSALRNRGDHMNSDPSWQRLTRQLDMIAGALNGVYGQPTTDDASPARHQAVITYADGYVETTQFSAALDAAYHAYATSALLRSSEHGQVVATSVRPVN